MNFARPFRRGRPLAALLYPDPAPVPKTGEGVIVIDSMTTIAPSERQRRAGKSMQRRAEKPFVLLGGDVIGGTSYPPGVSLRNLISDEHLPWNYRIP